MTPTADLMDRNDAFSRAVALLHESGYHEAADELAAALSAMGEARVGGEVEYLAQGRRFKLRQSRNGAAFDGFPAELAGMWVALVDARDGQHLATPAHPKAPEGEAGGEVGSVLAEVERATRKFPTWPTDPLHAIAVLGEEFGELTKAVLQTTYEPHKVKPGEVRTEAIQTAAMALRFVMSLDAYAYTRCDQHSQAALTEPGADDGQ